jgi:tetratricopeptide (TPR) repeat protein
MSRINWAEIVKWNEDELEELRFLGYAYLRQGKYDVALSFYEALSVLDPENAYDAQTLGALYLQLGNPAKALRYFDKALKLDADHSPTLLNLAKSLFMLGKRDEGLKLANVLKDEPNPVIANFAKALILAYS